MRYMHAEMETEANKNVENDEPAAAAAIPVVKWERFLPKMVIRILLVEADDSTRQIIAALLRKCSYKVAAVSDGLKAWEILKGNSHNIDLILTEVNLPSISGYALLTLIMEHEICKSIPIIMMSSRDSISTVYRCMLRGAADFLVKPVRINELRNLWQHIWRRQALSVDARGPLNESVAQQQDENNACSHHSSGYRTSIKGSRKCFEKRSDAESSCKKPALDNEGEDTEDISSSTQQNWNTCFRNGEDSRKEELRHEATTMLRISGNDAGGAAPQIDANTRSKGGDMTSDRGRVHIDDHTSDDYPAPLQAIDLIGAFDSHLKCDYRSSASICSRNNLDFSPLLDLSLTRSHPRSSTSQYTDENPRLNLSDASVFREIPSGQSISPRTLDQQKDCETDSDKHFSNHAVDNNSATHGPSTMSHNHVPPSCGKLGEAETGLYSPQQRLQSLPVPLEFIRFEQLRSAYSSVVAPTCNMPSGLFPFQCPGSRTPGESSYHVYPFLQLNCETRSSQQLHSLTSSQQLHLPTDQNNSHTTNHNEGEKGHKSESAMDCQHIVSGTYQSTKSCSGVVNYLHTSFGTNVNNSAPVLNVKAPVEGRTKAISLAHDMKSQREAAVTKFRLKRKDRCFDKKVRYESRKQLAEQRPRVKGQFVRQVPSQPL